MASRDNVTRPAAPVVNLTIGIEDALKLIPEYSGKDAMEYVHFYQGCIDAYSLLGEEHEKTLLKFIKIKLKGMAYSLFALKVAEAHGLFQFLETVQMRFCKNLYYKDFWDNEIRNAYDNVLPEKFGLDYDARKQNAVQCAAFILKLDPEEF